MSDLYDKSLMCWSSRRDCINKLIKNYAPIDANVMVWVLERDGKVHGAVVKMIHLKENEISKTNDKYGGLLWWPQEFS